MVPGMNKPTMSFKSAEEYYATDKRLEAEVDDDGETIAIPRHERSSERVAWTTTRNLMTEDSLTARNIMIATALSADRLKQEAGVKSTGRKSTKPVQDLTLTWHPGETPTREEMEAAADEVIELLGIEEHQITIYCHRDRPHPHIHLLINRVHPQNGRMAVFSNAHRKLDRWSHDYEKRRGNIVTPKRDAKFKRMRRAKEIWPDDAERRAHVEQKRKQAAERSPIMPENERWALLKAAQGLDEKPSVKRSAKARTVRQSPPLPSQRPTEPPKERQEARKRQRAMQRQQDAQRAARTTERRRRDEDARQRTDRAHRDRVALDEQQPEAVIFDALFCAFEREQTLDGAKWDRTRNPALEWKMALALRALDEQQPELRHLLSKRYKLPVDDPRAFRASITSMTAAETLAVVTAVDELDSRIDREPGRDWKTRRLAFNKMIERYGSERALQRDGESPQQIFRTVIKDICERSGLADFYRNTLKPLVGRMVEAVRSKQALEPSKQDPDVSARPAGPEFGI